MDIDNTLLQSLLREQGFKDFKPLQTDTSTDRNLYGYIKDDCFHVCNEHLAEVPIDTLPNISTAQCLLVYTNDNKYVIDQPKELNEGHACLPLLIDRNGHFLKHNIGYIYFYQSVDSFLQICHRPIDIPTLSLDTTYDPFKKELLIPDATAYGGHKTVSFYLLYEKHDYNGCTIPGIFLNGSYYPEYRYLFSSKEFHFIVRIDNESSEQILIAVSATGETIYESQFSALWFCDNGWIVIDFQEEDNKCILHKTFLRTQSTTKQSETLTYHGFRGCRPAEVEINCFGHNDILELITHLDYNSYSSDGGIIIISSNGKIIFEDFDVDCFYQSSHGLLFKSNGYTSCIMDTHGYRIAKESSDLQYVHHIVVFEHKILQPSRYNSKEIEAFPTFEDWYDNNLTVYEKLYGVLDTLNGEVLVPPVYSNISLMDGYVHNYDGFLQYSCIAIVSIDNYYKGNKSTHKGVYVNNNLVVPIGYTDITPVKSRIFASKLSNGENEEETLLIVTATNGKQGLYTADGNELLQTSYQSIRVFHGCIFADGKFLDKDKNILFDTEGYNCISLTCYESEGQFVFVDTVYGRIEIFDEKRQKEEEYHTMHSRFDFEKRCFVSTMPEENYEENDDYDYSQQDDYDYERDTYYALGGDDYDAFREDGGSIDDMMDSMGF